MKGFYFYIESSATEGFSEIQAAHLEAIALPACIVVDQYHEEPKQTNNKKNNAKNDNTENENSNGRDIGYIVLLENYSEIKIQGFFEKLNQLAKDKKYNFAGGYFSEEEDFSEEFIYFGSDFGAKPLAELLDAYCQSHGLGGNH